jgi:hypothetical protein
MSIVHFFSFIGRHDASMRDALRTDLGRAPAAHERWARYHATYAHMCRVRAHADRRRASHASANGSSASK